MDSVVIFQAEDWEPAFESALSLGRKMERTYRNVDGEQVAWRLIEIVSLDWIEAGDLNGAEVYSEPVPIEPGNEIPFDAVLTPEESEPTQTI